AVIRQRTPSNAGYEWYEHETEHLSGDRHRPLGRASVSDLSNLRAWLADAHGGRSARVRISLAGALRSAALRVRRGDDDRPGLAARRDERSSGERVEDLHDHPELASGGAHAAANP